MAFTASLVCNTVFGNLRVVVYNVTPDSTAGSFQTALPVVSFAHNSIKSMASFVNSGSTRNIAVMTENAGPTGTSIAGSIALTGCVANDVYRVIAYGPS